MSAAWLSDALVAAEFADFRQRLQVVEDGPQAAVSPHVQVQQDLDALLKRHIVPPRLEIGQPSPRDDADQFVCLVADLHQLFAKPHEHLHRLAEESEHGTSGETS